MRIAPAMLALIVSMFAVPFAMPAQTLAAARGSCTDWSSTSQPPPTIAVYRVSEGKVDRVDFQLYVARVASREWNTVARELRRAGAVAVKQYAWYHVLHWRGGSFEGTCFDVRDTTSDQLYAEKARSDIPARVWHAVKSTWSWRLYRQAKLPMTGYRRGSKVPCATDAGYRLFVRSSRRCAELGWTAERILAVYYTATVAK